MDLDCTDVLDRAEAAWLLHGFDCTVQLATPYLPPKGNAST
jgi:hypothetical protein